MEFNNETLKQGMREAIQKVLTESTSLDKITDAAYNAVMSFFVIGAIETARKNQGKE